MRIEKERLAYSVEKFTIAKHFEDPLSDIETISNGLE
jgi:hypothetical protein